MRGNQIHKPPFGGVILKLSLDRIKTLQCFFIGNLTEENTKQPSSYPHIKRKVSRAHLNATRCSHMGAEPEEVEAEPGGGGGSTWC